MDLLVRFATARDGPRISIGALAGFTYREPSSPVDATPRCGSQETCTSSPALRCSCNASRSVMPDSRSGITNNQNARRLAQEDPLDLATRHVLLFAFELRATHAAHEVLAPVGYFRPPGRACRARGSRGRCRGHRGCPDMPCKACSSSRVPRPARSGWFQRTTRIDYAIRGRR